MWCRVLEEIEEELMRSPVGEDMESVLIEKRDLVKRLGYEHTLLFRVSDDYLSDPDPDLIGILLE
jgi:hypothetical protein